MAFPHLLFFAHPLLLNLVRDRRAVKTAWALELDRPEDKSILVQPFIHCLTLGKLYKFYDFQLVRVKMIIY